MIIKFTKYLIFLFAIVLQSCTESPDNESQQRVLEIIMDYDNEKTTEYKRMYALNMSRYEEVLKIVESNNKKVADYFNEVNSLCKDKTSCDLEYLTKRYQDILKELDSTVINLNPNFSFENTGLQKQTTFLKTNITDNDQLDWFILQLKSELLLYKRKVNDLVFTSR